MLDGKSAKFKRHHKSYNHYNGLNFSEKNGGKVSVVNGCEVDPTGCDPILAFAKTKHLYAEGPDFLLSDLIIYPLYSLIMHRFSKVIFISICVLLDQF